jgi:hypothetical protein
MRGYLLEQGVFLRERERERGRVFLREREGIYWRKDVFIRQGVFTRVGRGYLLERGFNERGSVNY